MVVPAVLACLRKTRPGLAHEAKAATRHLRLGNGVNRDGERFFGFARSRGRHADSGFAVSRELGVNSLFLSSDSCAMPVHILLKNAVDASAVAFWRKCDRRLRAGARLSGCFRRT